MFHEPEISIIGFGALGQLILRHLPAGLPVCVCDPQIRSNSLRQVDLAAAARASVIVLAVPLSQMPVVLRGIAPHLRPGALVVDTCSVKIRPAQLMLDLLPTHVELLATHPLFGPQSARDGIAGHRIAWCPLRGRRHLQVAALLRQQGVRLFATTPDKHDREMAIVQGLTHLIARSLGQLGRMPQQLRTTSFSRLLEASEMVQSDSPELLRTILQENPHAQSVQQTFLQTAARLSAGQAT